jgi:urease accessory protein
MQRIHAHSPAGEWPATEAGDSVTLDYDTRHRRRLRLRTDAGSHVLLDLPRAVAIADGDGLQLDDGGWLAVKAAAEPVVEITAGTEHERLRIVWHLGNRHVPTELRDDAVVIRPDHVLEEMVVGLGGIVRRKRAPFQPEGGAYGGHAPSHAHGHGHAHAH